MTPIPPMCKCGLPAFASVTAPIVKHLCAACFASLRETGQDITYTVVRAPEVERRVVREKVTK